MAKVPTLSAKQIECVSLMINERMTVLEVANKIKVARSTVFNWFGETTFLDYYNKELDKFQASLTNIALAKIAELSQSSRESIALKASQDLLDRNGRQAVQKQQIESSGISITIGTDNE